MIRRECIIPHHNTSKNAQCHHLHTLSLEKQRETKKYFLFSSPQKKTFFSHKSLSISKKMRYPMEESGGE
jgi:hypothetical protein